ncbi:hypothetical protein [Pseudomonas sp. AM4(2022)]|uniref:hypothetical protein n=1 Tax=Pseudomonas sp. AM4(2022) TaxID=2983408 RepID=UPI002E81B720|nr:hypothetical protein [Pseudomonas sp. AM4(2022)]
MANLNLTFNLNLFALTESISVMKMLAEQAEKNVLLAVKEADEPGAVTEDEFEDEVCDQFGESYPYTRKYYSCGSCVGYDFDEVKSEYKFLITQLTRRSAFLTMFGLFEHRISNCLRFMIDLIKNEKEPKGMGPIEKAHNILKKTIGAKDIHDVDHLTVIRNIMIHNDGTAPDYNEILSRIDKKTSKEKRLLKAINRTVGVQVNLFNGIVMNEAFLTYAVSEFNRYTKSLEAAIQNYHRKLTEESDREAE